MGAKYVNTDLDLRAQFDLQDLVQELESRGVARCLSQGEEDGSWHYATLETDIDLPSASASMDRLLSAVESLGKDGQTAWSQCSRAFNFGYECQEDFHFSDQLEPDIVKRISEVGAAIVITIYRQGP